MARAHFCASLLGLGLMLAASSTDARELEFFIENRLGGDSNVFRRSEESTGDLRPKAGGVWEISPRLTLRDDRDELEYDFRYQPTYERFFAVEDSGDEGDFSGFDHTASAEYLWRVSPAASIGANGRFSRQRRPREGFLDLGPVTAPPLEQTDDEYVQRSDGRLFVSYALSPRFSLQGNYSFDDLDVSPQNQSDTRAHTFSTGVLYAIGERTQVGVNASYRDRETRASVDPDGDPSTGFPLDPTLALREFRSETQTFDVSFSISHEVTRRVAMEIAVGPSSFDTRDEDSLGNVSFSNDDSFFAVVRATYAWRFGGVEVGYTRSEGGGGGAAAASSILDSVTASLRWTPQRLWVVRLRGTYTHRESVASDAFFGRDTRSDLIAASANVQRRLTEELSLIANFRYSRSTLDEFTPFVPVSGGFLANVSRRARNENIQGFISVRYTFDPYVF